MKQIAQVIPYFYPAMAFGGPAKVVYEYSKYICQKYNVIILTSDAYNSERRIEKFEKLNNNNIKVIYFQNLVNSIAYKFRIFSHFGVIFHIIFNINKYNLYHFHDVFIFPHIVSSYILRLFNKNYIISPHGILDQVRLEKKSFLKRIAMIFVRPMINNAVSIVATSKKEMLDLNQLGYNNTKVIFNGIENNKIYKCKKFIKFKSNKQINLLFIGKLHHQKGLFELVLALYESNRKDISLLIAGQDDGDEKRLKNIVNKLNLKDQVKFLGFVNEYEKQSLYEVSDLFVHPSYSEGFSISILEALNAGIPVFITKQCNFPDVKKFNAGIIIEGPKVNNIKKEFSLLNKNSIKIYQLNAKKLIKEKYSIKIMSKEIIKLYDKYI
jgi:glycosyltransferase involved in cell wall biosynthesis